MAQPKPNTPFQQLPSRSQRVVLDEIGEAMLRAGPELLPLVQAAAQAISQALQGPCVVHLPEEEQQGVRPVAWYPANARTKPSGRRWPESISGPINAAWDTSSQPRVIAVEMDAESIQVLLAQDHQADESATTIHFLVAPLLHQEEILGTVAIGRVGPADSFSRKEKAQMALIGRRLALALRNAQRFEQVRQENRQRSETQKRLEGTNQHLQAVRAMEQAILVSGSAEAIAQVAVDQLWHLVSCQRICILLFHHETGQAELLAVRSGQPTGIDVGYVYRLDQLPPGMTESLGLGEMFYHDSQGALLVEGIAAYYSFPLIYAGTLVGALNLGLSKGCVLPANQLKLAEELAGPLTIAIQQARFFDQVERHAVELQEHVALRTQELARAHSLVTRLGEIAARLRADLTREEILKELGTGLKQIGYRCAVAALASSPQGLEILYTSPLPNTSADGQVKPIPLSATIRLGKQGWSFFAPVIQERQTLFLPSFRDSLRRVPFRVPNNLRDRMRVALGWSQDHPGICLPLSVEHRTWGMLAVTGAELCEEDLPAFHIFAGQVAATLQAADLHAQLWSQYDRQAALANIELAVWQPEGLQTALDQIVQITTDLLPATGGASIVLWRAASSQFTLVSTTVPGQTPDEVKQRLRRQGATRWILDQRRPLVVNDISADPFVTSPLLYLAGNRAYAGFPLIAGDEVFGVLYALDRRPRIYTQDDQDFLAALANRAAVAIAKTRVYERLTQANQELLRATNLKDEFVASMSHELRTPLGAILSITETLQEGVLGELPAPVLDSLSSVAESGRHLLDLINDILDLSKIEAGKVELRQTVVAVEALCQSCLRLVGQTAAQKRIATTLEVDPSAQAVMADQRRLKQILVNLLSNSVKFTPPGGKLGLAVQPDEGQGLMHFTVWDTGIGISPQDQKRLFQPFVQLDSSLARQHSGTGLGLVLVSRMTEMHGGQVAVQSEVGRGSRFTISLPWSPDLAVDSPTGTAPQVVPPAETSATLPGSRSATTILLVNDSRAKARPIKVYLASKGYRMLTTGSGEEALKAARASRPALILIDIQTPGKEGLEMVSRVRQEPALAATPIVALTAQAMPGNRELCLAAGATDYLSKPVRMRSLLQTIENRLSLVGKGRHEQ